VADAVSELVGDGKRPLGRGERPVDDHEAVLLAPGRARTAQQGMLRRDEVERDVPVPEQPTPSSARVSRARRRMSCQGSMNTLPVYALLVRLAMLRAQPAQLLLEFGAPPRLSR